ncbi:NrtR DNA-binding winged helix domain-containing protein [Chishuiella sp.]|uniref:NUDIX hydrolase n=1 Tax=Chishuiella sp. TaxID=1969467 RepID=UPI0028A74E19|nr:NUDIX hydrolase [Chishuiella sp.]
MTDEEKSKYFQVALCSSLVLFGFDGEELKILVYKKLNDPFKGGLILPGKYIAPTVSNDQAIHELLTERIAYDEHQTYIEQLKAFTKVFRNPLGRVVNVAYYALVKLTPDLEEKVKVHGGEWFPYDRVPDLAFDHNEIIKYAKERVKRRVKRRPVGFNLLGDEFTIAQLQSLYEKALNRELDKRNFRKKIFNSNLIIETGNTTDPKLHRKVSKLYRFDEEKYEKLSLKGYDFLF